jgi:hypothetical protein
MDGRGITKKARWITTVSGRRPRESDLAELLHEAVRVATMTRSERVAVAMLREDEADAHR